MESNSLIPPSDDLMTLDEIANYFRIGKSTVRKKVKQAREQEGLFPLPLFGRGCKLLWRKTDIENWSGENSVIEFTPSLTLPTHATQTKNQVQVRKGLKQRHGIDVSPQGNNEANG